MTSDADMSPATLYRLHACPFCERVVRKLRKHDVAFRSRFVEPLHSRRDVVRRVSGKRAVPVFVDPSTGATLSESSVIVDYLDRVYGGS